jgi:hypothetical protein
MYRLCRDAEFMCGIWQHYNALISEGDTSSASGTHVFMLFISTLQCLVMSRPSLLGVSVQMQGVGMPPSDPLSYSHSHSLGSVAEMVAMAASVTVLNVVGMIGTEAGLSVQSVAMKVQWCVSIQANNSTVPSHVSFLLASINLTRWMRRRSLRRAVPSLTLRRPHWVHNTALQCTCRTKVICQLTS